MYLYAYVCVYTHMFVCLCVSRVFVLEGPKYKVRGQRCDLALYVQRSSPECLVSLAAEAFNSLAIFLAYKLIFLNQFLEMLLVPFYTFQISYIHVYL